jgi:hypothetical protein
VEEARGGGLGRRHWPRGGDRAAWPWPWPCVRWGGDAGWWTGGPRERVGCLAAFTAGLGLVGGLRHGGQRVGLTSEHMRDLGFVDGSGVNGKKGAVGALHFLVIEYTHTPRPRRQHV